MADGVRLVLHRAVNSFVIEAREWGNAVSISDQC